MTTRDDLTKGIEPGSLPHGERDDLESGLADALGAGGPALGDALGGGGAAGGPLPLDSVDDPIAGLLGGDLDPGPSDHLTSGLSVGPGAGPAGMIETKDPKKVRLQQIATTAKSPLIRAAARAELRRLVGESL